MAVRQNLMIHKPLIGLLISYLAGLLVGDYLYLPAKLTLILIAVLLCTFLVAALLDRKALGTLLFPMIFLLIGVLLMNRYTHPRLSHNHISNLLKDEYLNVQGTLYKPPILLEDRSRLYVRAERVYLKNGHIRVTGNILLTVGDNGTELEYGDRIRFVSKLRHPRSFHNPGGFDYSKYLALEEIFVIGHLKSSRDVIRIGEGDSNYSWRMIERARGKIRNFIDEKPELRGRDIIKALLLGEQGEISEKTRDDFVSAGVAHILAISGLHLGFIALVVFVSIRGVLRLSERLMLALDINKVAAIFTVFPVLFYAFIAGFGVSTVRATIMIVTFLTTIVIDRRRELYSTLALAAFIITVVSPTSIFDVSFQLSFISVLSILYLTPRFLDYLSLIKGQPAHASPSAAKKIGKYTGFLLLVSVAAILGTGPIVAYHFNRVTLFGFISNIVIVPIIGFLIIPLCLLVALTIFISPSLASVFLYLGSAIIGLVVDMVGLFSGLPGVSFWVSTPTVLEIILSYLFLAFIFNIKRVKGAGYVTLVLLLLIVGDYSYWYYTKNFNRDLRVTFLSVGQGDSALIEFPRGKRMIIDGGGFYNDSYDTGRNVIAPFLWKEKIARVDYLLLSHPHPDHLNGLRFIAKNFRVKEVWTNEQSAELEPYFELIEIIEDKGIMRLPMNIQTPPRHINGVTVEIYNPPVSLFRGKGSDTNSSINNNSLVVKLTFKRMSFLFTGDVEEEAERELIQVGSRLHSTVIKVPHHGSVRSNTEAFVAAVKPSYAVFSVGYKNRFGFPKKKIIERYKNLGSRIYRTDRDGAITMITDGKLLTVRTFWETAGKSM
ncbi:MAG: DNA internalization-related competence protein ComEC/Rec2 [Pseudomonadota bacterium]